MESKLFKFLIIPTTVALLFTGCLYNTPESLPASIQRSGSLAIARLAPPVKTASDASVLGFLPFDSQKAGTRLVINRSEKTVSLIEGEKASIVAKAEGEISLSPGKYSIMHKQRAPLWYAGDSYFSNREIPVPPSGDGNRYLRGALGDFALFIDKDVSIHSCDIWTNEVGGLRVQDEEIRKIYYSLDVGSEIEIK